MKTTSTSVCMCVCVCVHHFSPSHAQHPEEEEDGEEEEERVLPVVAVVGISVAVVIACIVRICSVKMVIGIKDCGEEAEWKSTDSKRHVKPCVAKTLKQPSTLCFCSLTLRPRRCFQSGVFLTGAAAAVQRNHFIPTDSCFTYGTLLSTGSRLQPLMKTRPTEEMSTHADNRVTGRVQANVTLECCAIFVSLALSASTGLRSTAAARDPRSSGGRAVTRAPLLLRGLHPLAFLVRCCVYRSRADVTSRRP